MNGDDKPGWPSSDPSRLGGYQLEALIGRGTGGAVFRARRTDADGVDRVVAIKRVSSLGSDDDHERLRREAEIMTRLDHPRIVRVLEVVEDGADLALVMQYAAGGSLAQRIASGGPMEAAMMVELLAPVADALAAAHRIGVLHRDVKPSNVLFTSDGSALLADFGIARTAADAAITGTGAALGTAGYIAPELPEGAAPTERSDLYSLGVICYEALAGHPPFRAPLPIGVVYAAALGRFEPLDRSRHGRVCDVIERAMARDPADRQASVAEFAAALRASAASPSAPAQDPTPSPGVEGSVPVPAGPVAPAGFLDETIAIRLPRPAPVGAEPVRTDRRRRVAAVVGASLLTVIVGSGVLLARRGSGADTAKVAPYQRPLCDSATTAQCVERSSRVPTGVRVVFANDPTPLVFRVGKPTDRVAVANWFCGGKETLAVYRPDSGIVYYFDGWPDPAGDATAANGYADATGIRDATPIVGDRNRDGCADLALEVGGKRTWFQPAVQPGRLQPVPIPSNN